jgi:hypothetical protein
MFHSNIKIIPPCQLRQDFVFIQEHYCQFLSPPLLFADLKDMLRADERQIKLLSPLRAADKVIISAEGVREVIISADERQ